MQRAAIATFCAVLLLGAMTAVINYPNFVAARAPHADGRATPLTIVPPTIVASAPYAVPIDDDDDSIDNIPVSAALPIQEALELSWIDPPLPADAAGIRRSVETGAASGRHATMEQICATLASVAAAHELPVPFFVRLIWQESRFRTDAVSRAGARGIAQFMPGTARERGLTDPNDPIQSLHKSADFLRDLRNQFGNLGLAAAAYNGGPGRVQAWLNGRKSLPRETRNYVRIITGVPAEKWRGGENANVAYARLIPERVPCPILLSSPHEEEPDDEDDDEMAQEAPRSLNPSAAAAASADGNWSVVLAGSFSRSAARAKATRLKGQFRSVLNGSEPIVVGTRANGRTPMTQVRIPDQDRAGAEQLCARLRARGERCAVVRES